MCFKVRFAPSPTGLLHIGSVRTALFNWFFAKHNKGKLVLRIEDTDRERNKKEYAEDILKGLQWLGINWDEGPYYQSQRGKIYQEHIEKLLKEKKAYEKEGAVYFKIPLTGETVIDDLVKGKISFKNKDFKDQVIRKSDGSPTYNFAVVIDDALMSISHVIRGEDHISNTPKQLFMYQGLGYAAPKFAHIPLILAPDRSKLSKRHGAVSVTEYKQKGYLPEAMINYLSLLGWTPKEFPNKDNELMTVEQIIKEFNLDRVGKSGGIFDIEKLTWMNGQHLRKKDLAQELKEMLPEEITKKDSAWQKLFFETITDSLTLAADVKKLSEPFLALFQISAELTMSHAQDENYKNVIQLFSDKIKKTPWASPKNIEIILKEIISETKLKKPKVFKPLRIVLSGKEHGLPINNLIFLIGQAECLRRINDFLKNV